MAVTITTAYFDFGQAATFRPVVTVPDMQAAVYDFGVHGKVHAATNRKGQPGRHEIALTFTDTVAELTGLRMYGVPLTGGVLATGEDFEITPRPGFSYPLIGVEDARIRLMLAEFLTELGRHFYDYVNG